MFTKKSIFIKLFLTLNIAIYANSSVSLDSLRNLAEKTKETKSRIEILLKISKAEEKNSITDALNDAKQAYELAKTSNDIQNQVHALTTVARCHSILNNFSLCVQMAEEGIQLARKYNMKRDEAILKGVLGVVYAETGNADKSAQYYFDALSLFEELNDKVEIGLAFGNLGADFLNQKSYDKALYYMKKSLEIALEINDKQGVAQQYNNMAGVYMSQAKNYRQALYYFKKALAVNNEIKDSYQAGINQTNIGIVYQNLHINDSALLHFNESLSIFTRFNHPLRKADCLIYLSRFLESGDRQKSFEYAKEAFLIGNDHHSLGTILNAASLLHQYYLDKGDTSKAYIYSKIQHNTSDSIYQLQNQKSMFRLEFQYNQEKIDKERKLSQQRRNFIFILIIVGLLTGLAIFILSYSRQRIKTKNTLLEKEKTESLLRFKNKELSINLMALLKKNELLEEISEKLIKIEKEGEKTDARNAVATLNKELKMNIDDRIWKEFSTRFNETNHEFYEKLLAKYPTLTQNELKLCAYLRLNMTTKDISDLTGQRTETIEVARYRLRKKLGIANSDSNLVTFLSQI